MSGTDSTTSVAAAAGMDDFFFSIPDDNNEESSEAPKSSQAAAAVAQAVTEVPKLEYEEWFHAESKQVMHKNTGNSKKRIAQTELYRCQHLYYTKRYQECADGYIALVDLVDGSLKREVEDGLLHCYCKLKRFDDARQLVDVMLKKYPKFPSLWLVLGEIILDAESPDIHVGVKALQTAITLSPQVLPNYVALGRLYRRLQGPQSHFAKRCFHAALALVNQSEKNTKPIYNFDSLRAELAAGLEDHSDHHHAPFKPSFESDEFIVKFETEWFAVPQEVMMEKLHVSSSSAASAGNDSEEEDRDPSTL